MSSSCLYPKWMLASMMVGLSLVITKQFDSTTPLSLFVDHKSMFVRAVSGPSVGYDWSESTEFNYKSNDPQTFGDFTSIRQTLDYNYHNNYTIERQLFQDDIIKSMLNTTRIVDSNTGQICQAPHENHWIVLTAGCMGAGKSWTVRHLASDNKFPLQSFVTVDPDDIRRRFPEFESYVERDPLTAGELTRKEAGFVAEILTLAALHQGQNVLVDGSLRDHAWYQWYFSYLKAAYQHLKIGILHITAPHEAVLERAAHRAETTGRVVPMDTLKETMEQVPKSVQVLKPMSDFYAELHNAENGGRIQLRTDEGLTWESFRDNWIQGCHHRSCGRLLEEEQEEGEAENECPSSSLLSKL